MTDTEAFRERLATLKAERAARLKVLEPEQHDADLVPDLPYEPSETDIQLDKIIEDLGVLEAYRRWCGKSHPKPHPGQTEGIKVSCPLPNHPDNDPSAWLNTEKNTWFCGGCQQGGDTYDIAAVHFGYPIPGYKEGARFHSLREDIAKSLGYVFYKPAGADDSVLVAPIPESSEPEPETKPGPDKKPESTPLMAPPTLAPVLTTPYSEEEEDDFDEYTFPSLNWNSLVEPDTFLSAYMEQTSKDDVPEEYHFWNGLIAIGLAVGRDAVLKDNPDVLGNLFICTLGNTGSGKSRANKYLTELLNKAIPYDYTDDFSKGVKKIGAPASAEALIGGFSRPLYDPANPKSLVGYAPIRGLVTFNEFSALAGRAERLGNILKPQLMDLYDASSRISTVSVTHGEKIAEYPFGSVLTTTQPRALRKVLSSADAHSGFINRWIFVAGPPKKISAWSSARVDITPAVAPLERIHGWVGLGKTLLPTSTAFGLYEEFFRTTILPDVKADKSEVLTRLHLTTKKLMLLFALNSRHENIEESDVQKMIQIYRYLIDCYAISSAEIGNTVHQRLQAKILDILNNFWEKHKRGATQRELILYLNLKRNREFELYLVVNTLKYLSELGMIEVETSAGGRGKGRPTVRYKPAV